MTLRTLRTATLGAAAILLLSPASALAFAWTLRTGAEYLQDDSWSAGGERATSPRLDVDLGLDAGGSLGGPGLVDWGGGVGYRRTASSQASIDDVRERLSYRLRSSLFSAPGSRLTFSGNASRVEHDFSTEGAAAGSLLASVYGGDFWLRPGPERPWLRGGYTYTSTSQDTFALGHTDRTVHTLSASAGHGTPAYSYAASYRGNLSEGTFATDRYDDHRVDIDADVGVTRALRVRMTDAYYLRLPKTEGSALNPRQELTSFSAMLDHRAAGSNAQTGGYQYTHGMQSGLPRPDPTDPAAPPVLLDQERTLHRLGYGLIRVLPNPEWKIRASADATLNEERAGETIARNYGQSVGAIVFWRTSDRAGALEIRGGPRVGALEPATGDPLFGYGGTAGATFSRERAVRWQLNYDLRYGRDLDGSPGWSLQQHALAQGDGRLGAGILGASLQASGDRREIPPGTPGVVVSTSNATRTLLATLRYRLRSSDAQLQAGLQDGTVGALSGGEGDGLFLAPAFDSHSRFAAISASTALTRYLTARLRLRTQTTELPDRPTVDESEAFGSIEWAYGALRFAVEDRYVISSVRDGTLKVNQVLVRAYRVFGSRF